MSYLAILQLLLQLAGYVGRYVERSQVEKAFADALQVDFDQRAADAAAARAGVESGRVQPPDTDPNRRD